MSTLVSFDLIVPYFKLCQHCLTHLCLFIVFLVPFWKRTTDRDMNGNMEPVNVISIVTVIVAMLTQEKLVS